jgi:hypothetical protein
MNSYVLTGSGSLGTLVPPSYQGINISSVTIDIPLDEIGTTDPSVTISGSVSGVYNIHAGSSLNIRFQTGETVYLTANSFTNEYNAVINYTIFGGQGAGMYDINKSQLPIPSRLKRNPRNGS